MELKENILRSDFVPNEPNEWLCRHLTQSVHRSVDLGCGLVVSVYRLLSFRRFTGRDHGLDKKYTFLNYPCRKRA